MAAKIFVISAPSGTGKTTLNNRLVAEHPQLVEISISQTTRPIRTNEKNGVDYHFTSVPEFEERVRSGKMLEWANVFGNLYGTSLSEVERISQAKKKVILEIDVQGWQQAKPKLPDAVAIFIIPPSINTLWERLTARGTDALDIRWRRLKTAHDEIAAGQIYDYFIVNDDLESAYRELRSIVINDQKGKIARDSGKKLCATLLREFEESSLMKDLRKKFG